MPINSVLHENLCAPIDPDPSSLSKNQKGPTWYRRFIDSSCFKYTKIVLIVIYALNIVAWGGMLFLILVGGTDMTMPDNQTRQVWLEIDSQILNALFCVTGIGLIPWRVRDIIQFYSEKNIHKVLARHSYTNSLVWIQIVIWTFIANSLFQIGMALSMWTLNMYTRPPWLVGMFVGLGCVSGAFAGLAQLLLRRKLKKKTKMEEKHADSLNI
jgi:hypothetical protein